MIAHIFIDKQVPLRMRGQENAAALSRGAARSGG
jgi:hypothetical protein